MDFTRKPLGFKAAHTRFTKILQKQGNPSFFAFQTLPSPMDNPYVFTANLPSSTTPNVSI
jgi:hypothetical protein